MTGRGTTSGSPPWRSPPTGDSSPPAGTTAAAAAAPSPAGGDPDAIGKPIAVEKVPKLARQALDSAVAIAPKEVVSGPVTWTSASSGGDTIAVFRLRGRDGRGHDIEAEILG